MDQNSLNLLGVTQGQVKERERKSLEVGIFAQVGALILGDAGIGLPGGQSDERPSLVWRKLWLSFGLFR